MEFEMLWENGSAFENIVKNQSKSLVWDFSLLEKAKSNAHQDVQGSVSVAKLLPGHCSHQRYHLKMVRGS